MKRLATIARLVALALLVAAYAIELRAQETPSEIPLGPSGGAAASVESTAALSLAVAKVAANEASLATMRPAELALIWQVTEARGSTHAERLAWLRRHSSCVLTDRPLEDRERESNCRWTRGLRDSDAEPEGWYAELSWPRFAPRWAQVREYARRLVAGEVRSRPCDGTPFTWGSRRLDMARALERGLVPLGCRDPITGELTINEGFALRVRS